ncbi:SNF2-related protein [Ramlibacter sp.]|uniref:DEAD/DEAH box helicase n=1 Tax=Ramlibacter sp. TaxID=1917967 RepID=UPI0035B112A2
MSAPTFLLSPQSLARHVPAATYQRGLEVYRNQQVLDYQLAAASRSEWRITGEVQGTDPAPYAATVLLETDASGEVTLFEGDCSCPVGRNCKHAVALAIKAAYKSRRAPAQDASLPPAPPPAATSSPSRHDQAVSQWLNQFSLLPPDEAPQPEGKADQVVFLLVPPPTAATRSPARPADRRPPPQLTWGLAHPLKRAGGWTKPRRSYWYGASPTPTATAEDLECIQLIVALGKTRLYAPNDNSGPVSGQAGLLALRMAARSGRLFLADLRYAIEAGPLAWSEDQPIQWHWQDVTQQGDAEPVWSLTARLADDQAEIFPGPPALYLDRGRLKIGLAVDEGVPETHLSLLLAAPPMPQSAFEKQATLMSHLAGIPPPPTVKGTLTVRGVQPRPVLRIAPVPAAERARLGLLQAALRFDYGTVRGWWPHYQPHVVEHVDTQRVLLQRHLATEIAAGQRLRDLGLAADTLGRYHLPPTDVLGAPMRAQAWLDWLEQDFAPLRAAGFEVELSPAMAGFVQQAQSVDVRLTDPAGAASDATAQDEAGGWFDLSLGIEIEGVRQNVLPWLPELLAQVRATPSGVQWPEWLWRARPDGGYVRIPTAPLRPWLQALLDLVADRRDLTGETLRLSRLEALRVGSALGDGVDWQGAQRLRDLVRRLQGSEQLPAAPVPRGLQAQLRPYQQHGLDWLQFLRAHGLAGILADDMGLGKTLQTLAHVLAEQEAGRLDRPALVVAPVSLLGTWQREAARFTPSLTTLVWHGGARHGLAERIRESHLVITSYALLHRDRALWTQQPWHVVVLDEAQNIKNASTQAAQAAGELQARQRLCLSGTPLENHLGELWSQFHFLMPGFLGSQARFRELFRTPIEKGGDTERLAQLRRRITPFLLRRTKGAVAAELPPLVETVSPVTLEGAQADLYETIRLATERAVREALADKGLARSQLQILDALLKLRQVCCDPRLLPSEKTRGKTAPSAKLDLLMELLPEMLAEGRRVLLFSQFTSMLTLIEEALAGRDLAWTKLTGQTKDRDAAIARFTEGQVPLMLISLKAGGVGLNLPQADTVIHYDPWWNPAVEQQATARAHRIGQTSSVNVYKLVAAGTIEERILALQARKSELADALYRGAAARAAPLFTEDDVAELLQPLG